VRPVDEAAGFAGFAAPSEDESVGPADGFKVSSAIRVATKKALELGERTRKCQIRAGQDDGGAWRHLDFATKPGRQSDKHGINYKVQLLTINFEEYFLLSL
jgi:hypothetical protein